jgi:hypothetical protein
MDIMEMGASMLSEKLGVDIDSSQIGSALSGLLSNDGGQLDLGGLAAKMASSGGLGDIVSSWLGDGENAAISPDTISSIFGSDKLSEFASKLGLDAETASAAWPRCSRRSWTRPVAAAACWIWPAVPMACSARRSRSSAEGPRAADRRCETP